MNPTSLRKSAVITALSLLVLTFRPSPARAGGFFLLERGVRPLGRGGAFVAGADDPNALWFNPAGLAFSGDQLIFDASLTFLDIEYTRIDSGGNVLPTVHGQSAPLPIPTLGGSFRIPGLRDWTFGVAMLAPNAMALQYPETIEQGGRTQPAPQRYSMINMDGSLIAALSLGAAWQPIPELAIGLSLNPIFGSFAARVSLSSCDGAICTFPEDPDADAMTQMTLAPVFTATVIAGVTYTPGPVRIGFSIGTPYSLSGAANIQVRLPSAAEFDNAIVRSKLGDCGRVSDEAIRADPNHGCRATTADVNIDFPLTARFGVELLAVENLRLELAAVLETWSFEREVSIKPREVWMVDAIGFLDYQLGALSVPRKMKDTISIRLGGEYTFDRTFQIRLGGYYENGAFSDEYLTPMTIDSDKIVIAAGFSARVFEGLWLDVMGGYAHLFPRQVRNSRVPQPNPIRPSPTNPVHIGDGDYNFLAPFLGIGARWQLDWSPSIPAAVREESPPDSELDAEPTSEAELESAESLP